MSSDAADQRSDRLSAQADAEESRAHVLWEAAELLKCGVLMFDARGRIIHANRAAQRLYAESKEIRDAASGLVPLVLAGHDSHRLLVGAGSTAVSVVGRALPAPSFAPAFPRDVPAVVVHLHSALSPPSADILRQHFSFTQAEAQLAAALAAGMTLANAAPHLGITMSTARTRVKQLFAKTSTRNQGELVALLLSIPVV